MSISEFTTLFQLIGTTFGGNGTTTFRPAGSARARGAGRRSGTGLQSYNLAQSGGVELVILTSNQFASHTHNLQAAATATTPTPGPGVVLGTPAAGTSIYATAGTSTALAGNSVSPSAGGGQPHENRQPSTTINYIISLFGIFPSQA